MSRTRTDSPSIDLFLATRCERGERSTATVAEMTAAFNAWAAGSDEPSMSSKALTMALRARGVDTGRDRDARYYVGVGLLVTHAARSPQSLSDLRDMSIAKAQDEAVRVDAKRRLVDLIQQRRRLYVDARWDPELRFELDSIDVEILACERELSSR